MQLLSWHLWQRIQVADRKNPLYRRAFDRETGRRSLMVRAILEIVTVLSASPVALFIFPVVPFMLMLAHTLNGVSLATTTSTNLVQEKEHRTYDLITMTPGGAMSATWALTLGAMHRTHAYRNFCVWQQWIPRALPFSMIIFSVMTFLTAIDDRGGVQMTIINGSFFLVLLPTAIVLLLNADNIQSIVIATLTGTLIAIYTETRDHAHLLAVLCFLMLQVLVYLLVLYLIYLPLYQILTLPPRTPLSEWYMILAATSIYAVGLLAGFVGLREIMARTLWRVLQHQLNAR